MAHACCGLFLALAHTFMSKPPPQRRAGRWRFRGFGVSSESLSPGLFVSSGMWRFCFLCSLQRTVLSPPSSILDELARVGADRFCFLPEPSWVCLSCYLRSSFLSVLIFGGPSRVVRSLPADGVDPKEQNVFIAFSASPPLCLLIWPHSNLAVFVCLSVCSVCSSAGEHHAAEPLSASSAHQDHRLWPRAQDRFRQRFQKHFWNS